MTGTARVYGGSLYDLAAEENLTGIFKEELEVLRGVFRENPDYIRLLSEPAIPLDERLGLIETAFGQEAQRYVVNFIKLLTERSLLWEFGGCCDEFMRRYNQDNGIAEAVVTSAVELTDAQKSALRDKLEKLGGKKVTLITKIDPGVLAGLKVEMEGKQFDGTAAGRLAGISRRLEELVV